MEPSESYHYGILWKKRIAESGLSCVRCVRWRFGRRCLVVTEMSDSKWLSLCAYTTAACVFVHGVDHLILTTNNLQARCLLSKGLFSRVFASSRVVFPLFRFTFWVDAQENLHDIDAVRSAIRSSPFHHPFAARDLRTVPPFLAHETNPIEQFFQLQARHAIR